FVKDRFNLLYPQADSFVPNNDLGLTNPDRLFLNEFPFYNAIVAIFYKLFGINPTIARLVTVSFSSLGAAFLYLLTTKLFGPTIGLTAATYYAVNPYNIYYGRVIMPDPVFVSLSIISLYFFTQFKFILFSLTFALALLVKPYAIFILLPCFYWAVVSKKLKTFSLTLFALLPLALWRWHISLVPEGTFSSRWLYNETNIRFTGAFFRWLIFDRLNRLIFATGGFVLFTIGILNSYFNKTRALIFVWLLSVVAYMTIFAMGNVTHDYYQLPIMPVGAILVAFGFWAIVNASKKFLPRLINLLFALSLLVLSLAFGWYEVRGYFNINHPEIVVAGQAVDRLTPKDAKVIAPYNRDVAFLYQTNRHGWPEGGNLTAKISQGATHYASVDLNNP
ncbi:MAG: glycosyltransferase family 39 protein, partial [Patescibacteria group bacterium]|nr:glycosyltransferase family 39 protein [Patescibacteria group bacterium]